MSCPEPGFLTPKEALAALMAGNCRYVTGQMLHPHQDVSRRETVADGQNPFAVVLGCADSRVPPEILFDQGIGDLFVIRVAGNVVDDFVLGSVEYAVAHLNTPLIVVLGHSSCGAVTAAVESGPHDGAVGRLIAAISPAVEESRESPGDVLANAIVRNAERAVEALCASSIVTGARESGALRVVAACYDLATGAVSIIE
ncbi:MAG: carbonic anhydrase [Lentisphaerae bacterium]|jgi:carbonic anhydrase|nr:carbonic anhydrase [Lentisphaerota bacterium]MBT4819960.1 carbonic anhydrase [Lentisphaerota bacterium]MBT5610044.1 carbonic anhydrase [Lentisphaerota bacterium]MBT7055556.1 carbonic anhydrase [Lentisphaerota bacterium]MBT7841489.1 carbonic anhydrase [Lentisphaerota bacterium]